MWDNQYFICVLVLVCSEFHRNALLDCLVILHRNKNNRRWFLHVLPVQKYRPCKEPHYFLYRQYPHYTLVVILRLRRSRRAANINGSFITWHCATAHSEVIALLTLSAVCRHSTTCCRSLEQVTCLRRWTHIV